MMRNGGSSNRCCRPSVAANLGRRMTTAASSMACFMFCVLAVRGGICTSDMAPIELGLTDEWQHMIDSTTVRDHSQAVGARGGLIRFWSITRRLYAPTETSPSNACCTLSRSPISRSSADIKTSVIARTYRTITTDLVNRA